MTALKAKEPRYCDLVMKGGITSGLVYPEAVIEIARNHRLKNIGGTSAGAIAAALSAAAALGERRRVAGRAQGGMDRLRETATFLSTPGGIFSLFQPVPRLRAAYRLLVKLSAKPSKPIVIWLVLSRSVLIAPFSFALALTPFAALAYIISGAPGLGAAALPAAACAFAYAVYRAASGTAEKLRSNMLGMCPGTRQSKYASPALSDWMHREIRALAGLGEEDGPPVTFSDLWSAPPYDGEKPVAGGRMLNLEVITTGVSHMEPRTLPFARGTLWFLREDMDRLFPKAVVDAMCPKDGPTLEVDGKTYWCFPKGGDLPIVVAARMSLSFPVLICAVRLYEQHFLPKPDADEREDPAEAADGTEPITQSTEGLTSGAAQPSQLSAFKMRPCWFTDGGVSSNFPLHLFDAPMPRWPTFAIDLVYPPEGAKPSESPVFLPGANDQGWRPRYNSIDRKGGLQAVGAFLFGIVGTMQNWRDVLQGRAPGHRDRIVQVEIAAEEGGMNLDMPEHVLTTLADKGGLAGRALRGFDFENHFWVRYRNLHAAMERYGIGLTDGLNTPPAGAENAYARAMDGVANVSPYPFNVTQAREAARRIHALLRETEYWHDWDGSLAKGAPNPPPDLRIVPTF